MGAGLTPVTFVGSTSEGSSLDIYARRLAEDLDVTVALTDVFEHMEFGHPVVSRHTWRNITASLRFLRLLRTIPGAVHFPNHHFGRFALLRRAQFVITVHDAIRWMDLTGSVPLIGRPSRFDRILTRLDYRGVRRAAAVITPSEAVKRDLVELLAIDPDRVHVVPLGIDPERFHPGDHDQAPHRAATVTPDRYVLFVGSEHPRKNVDRVLAAFGRVRALEGNSDLRLVMVGGLPDDEPFRSNTLRAIDRESLGDHVELRGWVPEGELRALYAGAICLLLPSLSEGFGLPVIEAMACGCPVVTSTVTALPEVAGGAAALVDPTDTAAIAGTLRALVEDARRRAELSAAGLRRARELTWAAAARRTEEVYRTVTRGGDPQPPEPAT